MNVHVVAAARDKNWIIGRCVGILQRHTGWTVSPEPRDGVDVNYYCPYLLVKELPKTKTAAWFTHREEQADAKTSRWDRAAKAVDLRIAMAVQYERQLSKRGPAITAPLPIDLHKFVPRKLRVGVAGAVYSTGRKGEDIVRKLHQSGEFEMVAAGRGWPCPTTWYAWADMQTFYQSLDVFLVTSEVEGGPVTVMEALACGIPVVAPAGVGFVDEFDVLKYKRGDYQAIVQRLRALDAGKKRRRAQVQDRTEKNYVAVHVKAFKQLCDGV